MSFSEMRNGGKGNNWEVHVWRHDPDIAAGLIGEGGGLSPPGRDKFIQKALRFSLIHHNLNYS